MRGIKIYAFADEASEKIDNQIEAIRENNINGIEIRNVDGVNISDISNSKAREIKKKFDDKDIIVWSIGSPIGKIDIERGNFKTHIEKFKRTLEIAEILEAPNVRLFSFYIPKDKKYEDCKNEVIDRMGLFAEIGRSYNTTLCHENEKGIYGDNAERCLQILEAVPEIKGIFDPANFVQCEQDTLQAWDMLKNYIKYMHIKDALYDGTVVPSGMGNGNVSEIVKRFIKMGGRDFTIEPHLRVFSGFSNLEHIESETSISDKNKIYKNSNEAFNTAVNAFKNIIY